MDYKPKFSNIETVKRGYDYLTEQDKEIVQFSTFGCSCCSTDYTPESDKEIESIFLAMIERQEKTLARTRELLDIFRKQGASVLLTKL